MKSFKSAWLLVIIISAATLFTTACTSPNDAGKDVLPNDDIIYGHYVDTFSINMQTLLVDSVATYMLSRNLVGNYVDDQFGRIWAESYIQPRLTGTGLTFGSDPSKLTLDSIVLTLDLLDFYGKYNEAIPLEIFEITQDFDTSLYSRSKLNADTTLDLANGYKIDFSGLNGFYDFIGIRLDDSLGRKILFADPNDLASTSNFTSFFKGLMIRSKAVGQSTSREPGGVFYFDPRSEKSYMTIHYKDSTAIKSYTFSINASSERFHRIYRTDLSARLLEQVLLDAGNPNAMYGAVESGALVNLYVGIPSITSLDPAIINRANLILKVDEGFFGSIDRFEPPSELFLQVADSTHKKAYDPTLINSSATFDPVHNQYSIPMSNTIQQILAGRLPNNGFLLTPGENGVSLNRAVIGGPGHPSLSPELQVVYTTLPGK